MRIIDEKGVEILSPDYTLGIPLYEEDIVIAHHDAEPGVDEVGHYETVATYPNGGKDVAWVVEVPGIPPKEAWDETETILRWHWFTEEELAERAKPTLEQLVNTLLGVTE